jgi:predicted SAM-dependent methyltransferase
MSTVFFHNYQQDLMPVGVSFDNLSNINNYQDQSIDKILIQDLLDYIVPEYKIPTLISLKNKLKIGGQIEIQSVDIKQLSLSVAFDDVTTELAKNLLYPSKKNIHTMKEIINDLISIGFTINIKKYANMIEYYILATNNE